MTVFKKMSVITTSALLISGGALLIATNEKSNEEDKPEYKYINDNVLENSISNQINKSVDDIKTQAKENYEEFKRLDKIRIEKIYAQIDAEVERIKEKDRQRELERQRKIAEQKKKEEEKKQGIDTSIQSGWMTFNGSYYGADCYKCSGVTATGINVKNTIYYKGYRIIALDPNTVPLWSIVEVKTPNETFQAIVGDTGGRIKGFHADILVESEAKSSQLGRHNIQIRVIGKLNNK